MTIQRKHTLSLSVAALAVAIALPFLPARAQDNIPPEFPPEQQEQMQRDALRELDLSDEQLEQIRALREEAQADRRERREELRLEQQALAELLGGTASEDEVRSQFEQVQTLRQDLANDQFENILAMREILEPEQRSMLVENLGRRRDGWRRQMRGWGRPHRGPAGEDNRAPLRDDF
ncbi:MAG: Spy/CpxP family protein refolding chaperone [Cyanobacteria bacterium P01_A01_bin.3]